MTNADIIAQHTTAVWDAEIAYNKAEDQLWDAIRESHPELVKACEDALDAKDEAVKAAKEAVEGSHPTFDDLEAATVRIREQDAEGKYTEALDANEQAIQSAKKLQEMAKGMRSAKAADGLQSYNDTSSQN